MCCWVYALVHVLQTKLEQQKYAEEELKRERYRKIGDKVKEKWLESEHDDESDEIMKPEKQDDERADEDLDSNSHHLGLALDPVPETRQRFDGGAMVHMGKTAGSAISLLLRNGCHSFQPHPCRNVTDESIASKLIHSYYHVPDFGLLRYSHHDFYLLTVRDPYDRFMSAFTYEHISNVRARNESIDEVLLPRTEGAYQCFKTVQDFVQHLVGNDGNTRDFYYPHRSNAVFPDPCQDFTRAAFHGRVRIMHHLFFNYEKIQSLLPSGLPLKLYVTRQEFLWKDWRSINERLGQTSPIVIPSGVNQTMIRNVTGRIELPVKRELNNKSKEKLCLALRDEYRIYHQFIEKAENLQPRDVEETIRRSVQQCPNLKSTLLA